MTVGSAMLVLNVVNIIYYRKHDWFVNKIT